MESFKDTTSVEGQLGCFEVQNRMTDALDGLLAPSLRKNFDRHLHHCTSCQLQLDHLKELLKVMHHQPRASLPLEIRQDPLSYPIRRLGKSLSQPKKLWKELPATVRLLFEGLSIAGVVVLGIRLGPIVREFYENRNEKKLQTLIAAEDESLQAVPLLRGKNESEDAELSDEVANQDTESSAGVEANPDVQVGRSEIWRFNIKTDAPTLVRAEILKALKESGVSDDTPGIGGIEAPGGIQFDLLVSQSVIAPLKARLEKLASPPTENLPFSETFSWYKNRSKKPIPSGMSRVVIWLSQI